MMAWRKKKLSRTKTNEKKIKKDYGNTIPLNALNVLDSICTLKSVYSVDTTSFVYAFHISMCT